MKQKRVLERENRFLTPAQAAELLQVSVSTLKKLIYRNKIKTFKTPGGHHRILKSDLLSVHAEAQTPLRPVQALQRVQDALYEALGAFAAILESRHRFCHGHAAVVAQLSREIGAEMDMPADRLATLANAGLLHDVGMMAVPERVINKDDFLMPEDYEEVKAHPLTGAALLAGFPLFADALPVIRQHHERPDGKGYPYGLRDAEICREAKIIAVAESFDCMTAIDSYRRPLEPGAAVYQITQAAGSQFDPEVVTAFVKCCHKVPVRKAKS